MWTALYLMMAVAAWLVWRQDGLAGAKLPLALFAIQLALNSLWSVLFFGLHSPGAAAVEVVALWAAILATLITSIYPTWRACNVQPSVYLKSN